MKRVILFFVLLISFKGFSQPVVGRSNSSVTAMDSRLMAQHNLFLPRFTDTTAGNAQKGIDSLGAKIFTYDVMGEWLRVKNSSGTKYWLQTSGSGVAPYAWSLTGNDATTSISNFIGTTDAVDFVLKTGGTERLRALSSGNIGIGTSSPTSLLSVGRNDIQATQSDSYGFYLENATAATSGVTRQFSPGIVFKGSAWKTFGGGAAQTHLFRIDLEPLNGTTGSSSKFTLSANFNGAGYGNVMAISQGGAMEVNNVSSGSTTQFTGTINGSQIYAAASGSVVIGSGKVPGIANTVTVGINNLTSATSATANTAIGIQSMSADTSGGLNTAIGYQSLKALLSGISNTAVGVNSMLVATTSFQNTSIGAGSMEGLTTGQENTGCGYDAGLNATTAIRNVWLGWNAKSGTDGYENVIAGYAAGVALATGNHDNVFIGHGAGNNASQKTDAANSIGIGDGAYTTKSNQAVFGPSSITETILRGDLIDSTLGSGVGTKTVRYNPTNGLFTYADTTTGGGGGSPAGNFGNLQINRNAAFAAPGSDSVDFESATGLSVKGNINTINDINIGGATDNYNLNLYGSTYAYQSFQTAGSGTGSTNGFQIGFENTGVYFLNRQNTPMLFYTNNTSRMTIGAAGGITIADLVGSGSRAVLADASGVLSAPVSDARLKTGMKTIANYIDVIGMLRNPEIHGIFYNWKDSARGKAQEIGFTAQMFQNIPGLTGTMTKTGDMYLNYERITALLWEQNRLQQTTIDNQQAQLNRMEKKIDKLKRKHK